MVHAIRRFVRSEIIQTAAKKKFTRYKKETEKETRKAGVNQSPVLKKLSEAFKKYLDYDSYDALRDSEISGSYNIDEEFYRKALSIVNGLRYSSSDVEGFSLILPELAEKMGGYKIGRHTEEKTGMFLSALINNGKDETYVIHTAEAGENIAWFGYRNIKEVMVTGNIGNFMGQRMENGSITVNGDVLGFVGQHMKGGKITVHGSASHVGSYMKGGKIIIEGLDTDNVGACSEGGEIFLNFFDIASLGPDVGAKVYKISPISKEKILINRSSANYLNNDE